MPIIKSAKKRVLVAKKASIKNSKTKRTLRNSIKAFDEAITNNKDTTNSQNKAFSALDIAVKKNVISKNRAARKKKQLNEASRAAGLTNPGKKKTLSPKNPKKATKKTSTTKITTKKVVTKKLKTSSQIKN